MTNHQSTSRLHIKRGSRSRKGCPECRNRKIKCDEQTPQCGQCLKTGRVCRIVDSLFKPHSYTFLAQTSAKSNSQTVRARENGSDEEPRCNASWSNGTLTDPSLPDHVRTERVALARRSKHPEDSSTQVEETYHDRCEIAFFLRHFCEGPGQWMDICGNQPYFSQHAVVLSHWSPLIRYAACALAAKQLGQTAHPESQIRQTNTQSLMLRALIDTKLGFTWYGAKYYERAIQLLARQLSSKNRATNSSTPSHIYDVGLTPESQPACENEDESLSFQIIAACILCQYEDINATIRAWSGHIDGVFRLLRPHLLGHAYLHLSTAIPQPARALDATFWFFVVNDMLNAFVTHRKTRVDPDNIVLWCKMGLPLDRYGNLIAEIPSNAQLETVLFRALIRTMCRLVNYDLENSTQWSIVSEEFDRWRDTVPSSPYVPITWPPDEPNARNSIGGFSRETWFANDICAITVAFYHMSRIILLANRPTDIPIRQSDTTVELIGSYNTLSQELKKHATEVRAIMHAMPSERVQKYMLQPLYVAGRCLTDLKERSCLLQMLRKMEDDFGLFTDYRIQGLCEEWGMECSGIGRRDGHGIPT